MKQLQLRALALLLPFTLAKTRSDSSSSIAHSSLLRHIGNLLDTTTTASRDLQETTSTSCQSDQDCDRLMEYCSKGFCRFHGTCDSLVECHNPSNQYFLPACLGYLLCSSDGFCDIECGDSPCPLDSFTVECLEDPCQAQSCDVANTRCVETFCGGCNAIFFDPAGNHVCDLESKSATDAPSSTETVTESTLCSSDQDCSSSTSTTNTTEGQQQYCRQGECHDVGTCSTFVDCLNPANIHDFEENCAGYQTCSEDGRCRLECTDSPCPPGVPQVRCLSAPCDVQDCNQVPNARCVSDYCGGCNAYFFDAAGHQVCKKDDEFGESDVTPCTSDLECNRMSEYCSQGRCLKFGSCRSLSDCLNPSNLFETIQCVGYMTCDDGLCGVTCSDSPCPPGVTVAVCNDLPCDVEQCLDDPDARCANYLCGDCRAIFFDTAGNEVCSALASDSECQSDQDCTGENEICVDGSCWVEEQLTQPPPDCQSDQDCTGENEICVDGSCWVEEQPTQPPPDCQSDQDCTGENEICVDGSCWVEEQPTQLPPTQSPPPGNDPCPCSTDLSFLQRFMCVLSNISVCV